MGTVRADYAFVKIPIVGIARAERTFALRGRQSDVLRERVRAKQCEAAGEVLVDAELEGIVLRVADGRLVLDRAECLVDAARLRIAHGCSRPVDGGIEVVRSE